MFVVKYLASPVLRLGRPCGAVTVRLAFVALLTCYLSAAVAMAGSSREVGPQHVLQIGMWDVARSHSRKYRQGGYIDIPIIDDARQDLMSDVSFHFFLLLASD